MKAWQTWVLILAVGCAAGYALFQSYGQSWSAHRIAGVAIAVPAFCLWALARLQLGSSFAIGAEAKDLVTRELYARIQNPIYVFGALVIVGIFVFVGRPELFLLFLVLIPMQWSRIKKERSVLEAKFGDAYREYRKQTWF